VKHCFLPSDWFSQRRNLITRITVKGDILYVRTAEIAVIRNSLYFEEGVTEVRK